MNKPFKKENFIFMVKNDLLSWKKNDPDKIVIQSKKMSVIIDSSQLLYIKKIKGRRGIDVVMSVPESGSTFTKTIDDYPLAKVLNLVKDRNLLAQCHKSHIVNLNKIEEANLRENYLELAGNISIPFGKTYFDVIENALKMKHT